MTVLSDVLANKLDVVFCGTAVGDASALLRAYYAGPGNKFWETLHKALTPKRISPKDYRQLLTYRMGLTDLAKTVAGNDRGLKREVFDRERLKELVATFQPRILAFTGKRAAEEFLGCPVAYGKLLKKEGATILFVLTSPSGSAKRYWSEDPWRQLKDLRDRIA